MTREEKINYIVNTMSEFQDIDEPEKYKADLNKLSDEELEKEVIFTEYLWDK